MPVPASILNIIVNLNIVLEANVKSCNALISHMENDANNIPEPIQNKTHNLFNDTNKALETLQDIAADLNIPLS